MTKNNEQRNRVWITHEELDALKEVFQQELQGKDSTHIPFERILPLLQKPDVTRILWCRVARREFNRWGLRVGVRNSRGSYRVKIVDLPRWQQAITGLNDMDSERTNEPMLDDDSLIPKPDPFYIMPEWSEHLLQSVIGGEKVMIAGPTGAGKSTLVQELAARHRKSFMRVNLTGETSVSDILGGWRVRGREMVFQYGPVPQAMKVGAWLCLDELDAALPQVLFALQALLEDEGKLFLPDTTEWIAPHEDFRLIATTNTIGRGDDSGLYAGTNVLNEAFLDRFHAVFTADYLPQGQEIALLVSKVEGLHRRTAEGMVRVANDLRGALKHGVICSSFSTRKLLAWGKKAMQLGCPKTAAQYTVLNKLTADDQKVVAEVLQRNGF